MEPVGSYSGQRRGRNEVLIWCISMGQGSKGGKIWMGEVGF